MRNNLWGVGDWLQESKPRFKRKKQNQPNHTELHYTETLE